MKKILVFLILTMLSSCKEISPQIQEPQSKIVAYIHWGDQSLSGRQIELVQTRETKLTDSNGLAYFSVHPGKYIVRAFNINRGGPALRSIDFDVEVLPGRTTKVDIVDCLPCL